MNDGSININTKLDNSGFMKNAREFKRAVENLQTSVVQVGQKMATSTNEYIRTLNSANKSTSKLSDQLGLMGERGQKALASITDIQQKVEQYRKLQDTLRGLNDELAKYKEAGVGTDTNEYKTLTSDIKETEIALTAMNDANKGFDGRSVAEWANSMNELNERAAAAKASVEQVANVQQRLSDIETQRKALESGGVTDTEPWQELAQEVQKVSEETSKMISVQEGIGKADFSDSIRKQLEDINMRYTMTMNKIGIAVSSMGPKIEQSSKASSASAEMMKEAFANVGAKASTASASYVAAMNRARESARAWKGDQASLKEEIGATEKALVRLTDKQEKMKAIADEAKQRQREQLREKMEDELKSSIGYGNFDLLPPKSQQQALNEYMKDFQGRLAAIEQQPVENTRAWQSLQFDIDQTKAKLMGLRQAEQQIGTEPEQNKNVTPGYITHWKEMVTLSSQVTNAFRSVGNVAGMALTAIQHPIQAVDRALGFIISKATQAVSALARMAGSGAVSFLKKLASTASNAAIQLAKLAAHAVSSGLKRIGAAALEAGKNMLGLNKHTRSSSNSFKQNLTTVLKYGFGIRSLYFLFRRLRSAISDGLGEISKQTPALKAALTSTQTAFSALKGSLASAFAPIYTAIAPAITYLINLLSSAITTIASFFSALTGNTTVAKSIGTIGSSAKKSGGAVKDLKRELAGFDTLNVLSDDKSSGGGGGGGKSSGMAYTTEQIESSIQEFVNKLKELWTEGKYEEIGELIAEGINKAFDRARSLISWQNVESTVEGAVTAITGILNGLVSGVEWGSIGETFGAGADTIMRTVNSLYSKIKFYNIGGALAEMLNGLIRQIDPAVLGKFVTNKFNAVFAILRGFVRKFSWYDAGTKFGETVGEIVNGPNWTEIGETLGTLINGALASLGAAISAYKLKTEDTALFADAVNSLVGTVDWIVLGRTLANGIHLAINRMKAEITNIQWGNAGQAFADALNGFFEDDSLFTDAGETIEKAILGILTFGEEFLNKFKEGDAAENLKKAVRSIDWSAIATEAWNLFKLAVAKLGNFLTVLFGTDEKEPIIKPGTVKHQVEKVMTEADKAAGGDGIKMDLSSKGMAEIFTNVSTTILEAIKAAFAAIPWKEWGADIHDFIVGIDWGAIATDIWNMIVEALNGIEGFIYTLIFGENYKSNPIYQMLTLGLNEWSEELHEFENQIDEAAETAKEFENVNKGAVSLTSAYLKGNIDNGVGQAVDIWEGLRSGIGFDKQNEETKKAIAEVIGASMEGGVEQAVQTLSEKGFDVTGLDFSKSTEPLGEQSVDGIIEGVEAKADEAEAAVEKLAKRLPGEAKRVLQIESPSKVFEQIGIYAVDGLINGLNTLPLALNSVWYKLPEWAQTMFQGGSVGLGITTSAGGTPDGKISKGQTKATKDLTKELRKKKATAEIDVNLDGNAGLQEIASGKATTTVQVGFVPEGQQDEEEPTGLLAWLQQLFDPGVSVETKVKLVKEGWNTVTSWVQTLMGNPVVNTLVSLIKNGWTTVTSWVNTLKGNTIVGTLINLVKNNWTTVSAWVNSLKGNTIVEKLINLARNGWTTVTSWVETFKGSTAVNKLIGLIRNNWTTVSMWVKGQLGSTAVGKAIDLLKNGWETVSKWVSSKKGNTEVKNPIDLAKDGWKSVSSWVKSKKGTTTVAQKVDLTNKGSNWKDGILKWLTGNTSGAVTLTVSLIKGATAAIRSFLSFFGLAAGGSIDSNGVIRPFASGGAIMRNGRSSWWNSVNKYAAGTSRAHGTVFVAGENGPEIMGHVNGRTEILNKSQLADALYGAVVSGMSQAVNALGAYIVNHMTVCTNAIVSTIAANSLPTYGLSSYYAPAMASGAIMPYEVAAQIARSTADIQNTLDTNNEELIQAMVSAISNAAASIVMAMNLHGNNNNAPLTARAMSNAVIDEINRRTRMTGQSPLMGV